MLDQTGWITVLLAWGGSLSGIAMVALISWGKMKQIVTDHEKQIREVKEKVEDITGHTKESAITRGECNDHRERCTNNICNKMESIEKRLIAMDKMREDSRKETKEDFQRIYDKIDQFLKNQGGGD